MLTITQQDMTYNTALDIISQDRKPKGLCRVEFEDKAVEAPVRAVLLQLPAWEIYRMLGHPVYSKHLFFTQGPYGKKVYKKMMHQIYRDVFRDNNDKEYFYKVKDALWVAINHIDEYGTMELNEYHCTLSIVDLAEIATDPKIKPLRDIDIDEKNGTVLIKQRLLDSNRKLLEYLRTRGSIQNDALCDFIEINSLKESQVGQVIISYGLRTEINDRLIKRPVYGSSLTGYQSILDYAIDNQAARKNVYFAHDAIRKSQYFNRKMAIALSILRQLYKEFCKTRTLLPWTFTETNYDKCYGKIFIDKDLDQPVILTAENFEQYLNREILMYSPLTCAHTDGICHTCFGALSANHTDGCNIGFSCASNFVSVVSQLILSTKHVDQATPTVYVVPEPANEVFRTGKRGIVFTAPFLKQVENLEVGVFYSDIHGSIGDLQHFTDELSVPDHRYSEISTILVRNKENNAVSELQMRTGEMMPFLTLEFLGFLRDHFTELRQEKDVVWIPLGEDYKKNPLPIMRSVVYNNSMLMCVEHISNFVEKNLLRKYHNATAALKDFSELVFQNVSDINIVQLEALLRAHMVTSESNYSLPIVTDVNDVHFRKTEEIISERTIAGQLVYEKHNIHFAKPRTYISLKDQSPFDPYFNI